ncbi:sensor histidine kinase [Aureibacillus halotolerans]|uniref:histidine kinase n=1 Tax=Aureibacillus halotolerans TaxID=1508390 RepID=A0A4R6TQ41_9BACI|nr:HAMP domain-containing sensor histidine kinase [Aureibacillus halotolerans]TDQ34627.1 signal transduction histidine kinase [Aureibacillus halotolerans]
MTTVLLSVAVGVLLLICLKQFFDRRRWKSDVKAVHASLDHILTQETREKVFSQTDETELQRLLAAINTLLDENQRVQAASNKTRLEQRKMLSNISHDLKTPLTVMLGYLEKLEQQPLLARDERERTLSQLHQKTLTLIKQVNAFFDFSKLEAGDVDVPMSRIHLNEVCRQAVLEHYAIVQSKGLAVELDLTDEPIHIYANEEAFQRVLGNLLTNAIRYGADGKVLGLKLYVHEGQALIEVWDKGRGIPETEQDNVFNRMYTLDDARHASFEGSGLGLSITKQLVEMMGGHIVIRSIPYEKTTFRCTFNQLPEVKNFVRNAQEK